MKTWSRWRMGAVAAGMVSGAGRAAADLRAGLGTGGGVCHGDGLERGVEAGDLVAGAHVGAEADTGEAGTAPGAPMAPLATPPRTAAGMV